MSVTITLHPGVTLVDGDRLTITALMNMWDLGYATIDSGTIDTASLSDNCISVAKLAATLDLSSNTVTLPADLMPVAAITSAPDFVGQIAIVGGVEYVAHGTSAVTDWERIGPAWTAITAAPSRVGEVAIVAGKLYYATGVADTDDWTMVDNPESALFAEQTSDVDGTADNITVFCKDSGSQIDMYFRRGTAAAQQWTGTASTALNDEASPDWDSGWTKCNKAEAYDLTDDTAEGFSDTAKGDDTTGETDASGTLSFVEYRLAKIHVKKSGSGPFVDYFTFLGEIPMSYSGWGAYLLTTGGSFAAFDNSKQDGDIDLASARLYMKTGDSGILATRMTTHAAVMDWDEKTNWTLGDSTDECLVRIQLWQ